MSELEHTLDPEELLAHADWVRSLARSLVHDPHRAADVEQDSWLEALRHPPRHASNPRAWLARVVRSAALKSARSGARRVQREQRAAVREALPATDDVVAQAEHQGELARRVLAMEEPFRTVILLRYFQALPPREIAQRLERPLNTVRSQLQRGLEQLRRELDGKYGERGTWCALLLPLTAVRPLVPTSTTPWIGSLFMGTNVKLGLLSAAVIAALTFGLWRTALGPRPDPGEGVAGEVLPLQPAVARAATPPGARPAEERRAVAIDPAPATEPPLPWTTLRGRTVDLLARPLGGVGLRWEGVGERELRRQPELEERTRLRLGELARTALLGEAETPLVTTSGSDGGFTLELPVEAFKLGITDEDRLVVATGWVDGELWVLVSPALPMNGTVVDEGGRPIAGASVRLIVNAMSLRDFGRTPDWEDSYRWLSTVSDANGSFTLPRVPLVSDRWEADTFVSKEGFETAHPPLPKVAGEETRVVLRAREEECPRRVTGVVHAPRGAPVPGAGVFFGRDSTQTDAEGRFELPIEDVYDAMDLLAIHPDYTAGHVAGFGTQLLSNEADFDGVVIVLGPAPLSIHGRIVAADGEEAAGFLVSLQDGTPLGATGEWAELHALQGSPAWVSVDEHGRFELPGLEDRPYRVRAWRPETAIVLVSEAVRPGGEELVLRIPDDATEHLVGFAVDRLGTPVADTTVMVTYQDIPGVYRGWRVAPFSTTTDAQGRFEIPDMPRHHVRLMFDGPHVLGDATEVPAHADGEPVTLEVPMLTRFRVELEPEDPADGFSILTTTGAVQRLSEFHSWGSVARNKVARTADGFPVCICSDDVGMIVLYAGERELRRVPLALPSGGVHVVRP